MQQYKCQICGRLFTVEEQNDEDDFFAISFAPKPSTTICTLCEAKILKEAKDKDKPSKPM